MRSASSLLLALIVLSSIGYAKDRVVYGEDNRKDIYDVKSPLFLKLAKSTAVMINNKYLTEADGVTNIDVVTLQAYENLCSTERFINQNSVGDCSGFLVAPDLLLTAGHCATSQDECDSNTWIFDYKMSSATDVADKALATNVYKCKEIVSQKLDDDTQADYALIRLDRAVTGRAPLKFRFAGKVSEKSEMVVIGHPTGLPTKVSDAGDVRDNSNPYFFVTNLDTFGGNSGSAVFDVATGAVEGILVRGEEDYIDKPELGCKVVNVCKSNECRGEDVTRLSSVAKLSEETLHAGVKLDAKYVKILSKGKSAEFSYSVDNKLGNNVQCELTTEFRKGNKVIARDVRVVKAAAQGHTNGVGFISHNKFFKRIKSASEIFFAGKCSFAE